jgi:hypothetical protein
MPSSEIWGPAGLVRIHVSEERVITIFRAERNQLAKSFHSEGGGATFLRNVYLNKRHISEDSFLRDTYILLFTYGAGVEPRPLLLLPVIGLLFQPWMIDDGDCGAVGGFMLGSNPGRPGGKPATSRLSYDTELFVVRRSLTGF